MPIYDISNGALARIQATEFITEGLKERQDIQRLVKQDISVLCEDTLLIAEEFGDFEESRRRIDLLAIDKDGNLVVIELKRTDDGGHMELQAIRYASMVANMTWSQAVKAYEKFLTQNEQDVEVSSAEKMMLDFLGWEEGDVDDFGQKVKIVLASANFSKELTTSVLWLNDFDVDITCLRMTPYKLENKILLNIEQVIPVVEAQDYQTGVREKKREQRQARSEGKDRSLIEMSWDGEVYETPFKKAEIGYLTIQLLHSKQQITAENFQRLRTNKSCSFELLKQVNDVTNTERKYRKYRIDRAPELVFQDQEYYVARNWGIANIDKFIAEMKSMFPSIDYRIVG
ncbi:hypothetical protein KFE96_02670 [Kordiimonas sp. SCSIO 12603]|uniref:hypothetical protein n=1 Tax=Kordiimonas sp. SCSIO 12603 TaxID=2829596 RepID=UPI00210770D9|nr:hypothetical protein [Kordiimonas sp. SCSIO 12603]UTW59228.1 hypothetical protein KFE96_02670 [Kordiimonas sp. SCSIO 12603]